MKKYLFVLMCFLLTIISAGCGKDDQPNDWQDETDKEIVSDPNSIIGKWELSTLYYPGAIRFEIPLDQRDLFLFSSKGQVKVIKKNRSSFPDFPNEDGDYDYSYDKEKQTIELCGIIRECVIMDEELYIESGYNEADSEPIQYFIFTKQQ